MRSYRKLPAGSGIAVLLFIGVLGFGLIGSPSGLWAEGVSRYGECIESIQKDPRAAYEAAEAWAEKGGGGQARHCAAMALQQMGEHGEAAAKLEELVETLGDDQVEVRVRILGQIGQAWFYSGQVERALEAQDKALDLNPDAVEILIDRAISRDANADYWGAVDDLDRALELDPNRADALTQRASAYRLIEAVDLAWTDVERALSIAPNDPFALFERGILNRLSGKVEAAKSDWQRVIAVSPQGRIADLARQQIALIEGN